MFYLCIQVELSNSNEITNSKLCTIPMASSECYLPLPNSRKSLSAASSPNTVITFMEPVVISLDVILIPRSVGDISPLLSPRKLSRFGRGVINKIIHNSAIHKPRDHSMLPTTSIGLSMVWKKNVKIFETIKVTSKRVNPKFQYPEA